MFLAAAVPGITDRVLSMRLKELTDSGRPLKPILDEVERWALRWNR